MILSTKNFSPVVIVVCLLFVLSSCTEEKFLFVINRVKVKNYPVDTPFVFNNRVNITGNINKDERTRLQESLVNYWDDSLFARRVQKLGFRYILRNPPVFDTSTIGSTAGFMNSFLFSQGYFNAAINDTFHIDTFRRANSVQQRTTVEMNIDVGNRVIIDSLAYKLNDTGLLRIAHSYIEQSKIEPGKTPYSKEVIAAELDRLVALFRDRGYFLLRRNNIVAVVDTTDTSLLRFPVDLFEQLQLFRQAQARQRVQPTASVSIQQRRLADTANYTSDTSFLKRFYIGNVYYFPELFLTEFPDTVLNHRQLFNVREFRNFSVYYRRPLFRPQMFRQFNYLRPGHLYSDDLFFRTVNTFNQVGAWKQVDTRTIIRGDSIDLYYFLYPDKKQNISYNLELSRNTGDILTASNFFGIALNITYKNRNVWRNAVQSSTSFINGVEFSFNQNQAQQTNSIIRAFQVSLGQTYSFPRAFIPFKIRRPNRFDFGRTVISANASYADRRDYFRLRSVVADYGYDWKRKNKVWLVRFPNIELYSLDTLPLLTQEFQQNPFLRNSFNTGKIISMRGNLIFTYGRNPNITNYARFSTELCLPGLNRINDRIYQYVKAEAEFRKSITLRKTVLAARAFAGIGYNYYVSPALGVTLPFYKQFIAGGPNSMRAWGLRQLGLGSSLLSDTSTTFRDRYGDMQLEANVEYRYLIAHFTSVNINGAVFADAGNIWNVRKDENNPNSEFNINRLGKDIALGIGTGLRFDFNYFLVRIDMGIKLKDPARIENNGWLDISNFTWRNREFDKFDTNGNLISAKRNNYAVQLGIGLPF